jgi:hypothetical protein
LPPKRIAKTPSKKLTALPPPRLRDELLNGEIFYTLREAQIVIESWRRHYKRASQHPSVYVIEENRLC